MEQALKSFHAERDGADGSRLCHREHLIHLAVQVIEEFRKYKHELTAVLAELPQEEGEMQSSAEDLAKRIFGPRDGAEFLAIILLQLDAVLRRPYVLVAFHPHVHEAFLARNAALEGDAEVVDAFTKDVLGRHPGRWRGAVEMALLGDWVDLWACRDGAFYVKDVLEREAEEHHSQLKPLWKRKARGKQTLLLGQPVGATRTVEDLLVDHRTPEQKLLSNELDTRIASVLKAMRPAEQALALEWSAARDSWGSVARELSYEQQFGDRVRRKLKRLGARHMDRAAAADRTARRLK